MAKKVKTPKAPGDLTPRTSTAGTLVLQWLTYAFWGWFTGALVWLIGTIFMHSIVGAAVNETIPYAIAATIVLFPLAFVCDLFYRKHEPLRKAGAAMVIMLIHAVIFALLAIGALITAVFTGLNALLNETGDSSNTTSVVVYTAASAAVLFGVAFLRTLNPFKQKLGATIYAWGMLGLTIILLVVSFVGPVAKTVNTRDDRALEEAVTLVNYGVQNYVYKNGALPENLKQINVESEVAKTAIESGDIEYIPEEIVESLSYPSTKNAHYQLCVTYDQAVSDDGYKDPNGDWDSEPGSDYKSYPRTVPRDAGRTCYKLYVRVEG